MIEALGDSAVEDMIAVIAVGLLAQYQALDVAALVALIRGHGIDIDDIEAISDTADLIADNELMPPAADSTDLDELAALLVIMASIGIDEGVEQATNASVTVTDEVRTEATVSVETYADGRVQQLYVEATGDDTQSTIESVELPQTLDPQSHNDMARLTVDAMRVNPDDAVPGAVSEAIPGAVATRSEMIAKNESGRSYNNGLATIGAAAGAIRKRWNRTRSDNPRQIHLDNVGQIVDIDAVFRSGDSFAGELPLCKCSITLLF